MSTEIELAFAHPSERSMASAPEVLDRISLRDYVVSVEIGAFQAERDLIQRLKFNVVVEVYPLSEDAGDDVDRILSYDRVSEAIDAELAAQRLNLLETLAERVADRILHEPQAARVFVRIEKTDRGPWDLGVEIVRARGQATDLAQTSGAAPIILFLSNAALASGQVPQWLDTLEYQNAPILIMTEAPDGGAPQTSDASAQQHIALLAIELNAWVLAAQDPRLKVVDTWTELDWGMKNNQISVWAPSKIVLDAVDGPKTSPDDTFGLINWFARAANASAIWMFAPPCEMVSDIPVTWHDPTAQIA